MTNNVKPRPEILNDQQSWSPEHILTGFYKINILKSKTNMTCSSEQIDVVEI